MIVRATKFSPCAPATYWKRGAFAKRCGWRETATMSACRSSAQKGGSARSQRKTGASWRSLRHASCG